MIRPHTHWKAFALFLCSLFFSSPSEAAPGQCILEVRSTEATLQEHTGERIAITVINTFKGQRQGWARDIADAAKANDSDFLLLQEATDNPAAFVSQLPPNYSLSLAHAWKPNRGESSKWVDAVNNWRKRPHHANGVMTGSRVRAKKTNPLVSDASEALLKTKKSALAQYYDMIDGSVLLLINVHALNFTGIEAYRQQLNEIFDLVRHHEGPAIVAGDFNTTYGGETWGRQKALKDFAQEDAVGLNFLPITNRPKLALQLDHVLYRGLVPIGGIGWMIQIKTSDHNIINASFTLPPAQARPPSPFFNPFSDSIGP